MVVRDCNQEMVAGGFMSKLMPARQIGSLRVNPEICLPGQPRWLPKHTLQASFHLRADASHEGIVLIHPENVSQDRLETRITPSCEPKRSSSIAVKNWFVIALFNANTEVHYHRTPAHNLGPILWTKGSV